MDGDGLLVLARREGESVVIGDDVQVFVVSIDGDKVRLGFRGPKSVSIHRREIWEKIQAEREAERGK